MAVVQKRVFSRVRAWFSQTSGERLGPVLSSQISVPDRQGWIQQSVFPRRPDTWPMPAVQEYLEVWRTVPADRNHQQKNYGKLQKKKGKVQLWQVLIWVSWHIPSSEIIASACWYFRKFTVHLIPRTLTLDWKLDSEWWGGSSLKLISWEWNHGSHGKGRLLSDMIL